MSKKSKKLLILLFVILVIGTISLLGIAFLNANKLIAQFKPQLEESISAILGSKVTVGEIKVQVFPETAFNVDSFEFEQKSDAAFTPKFKSLSIKLELLRLLQGELAFKEILLDSPEVKIRKSASKPKEAKDSQDLTSDPTATQNNKEPKSATSSLIILNLEAVQINNAVLELEDIAANKTYKISDFDLSTALKLEGRQVSLKDLQISALGQDQLPIKIRLPELSFANNQLKINQLTTSLFNATILSAASFDTLKQSGEVTLNSESLVLQEILKIARIAAPQIPEMLIAGEIKPEIKAVINGPKSFSAQGSVAIKDVATSQAGFDVTALNGNIKFQAKSPDLVNAQSSDLSLLLNAKPIAAKLDLNHQNKNLKVSELLLTLLGGQIKVFSNLNLENKNFDIKLNGSNIQIAEALELLKKSNLNISGNIVELASSISGTLGQDLLKTLRGSAKSELANGAIKGFNLAGIVLKAVKNLPFITGSLYASMPASEKAAVDSSDTAFSSLIANLEFVPEGIALRNLNMESPIFSLNAKGIIRHDLNLDLKATIYFSESFSSMLVRSVQQLKYGLDDKMRLVIPLQISGTAPNLTVLPDLQKLVESSGKKLLQEKATDAAKGLLEGKSLGKILGF